MSRLNSLQMETTEHVQLMSDNDGRQCFVRYCYTGLLMTPEHSETKTKTETRECETEIETETEAKNLL